MSDNRKYITSTGLLLKSLNQEPMQSLAPPPPSQQQHQQSSIHHHYPSHPHPHHHQHHPQPPQSQHINAYTTASHYTHQPQPPQSYLLQHPSNFTNLPNIGGAPPTNTVSSYISQDLISRFPKKQTQPPPPQQQQQQQQQNVNKQIPKRSSTHQLQQQQQQQSSSSTVTELPETFGLPSDFLAKSKSKGLQHIPKYTTSSSSSLATANATSSSTNLEQLANKKLNEQQQQQNSSLTESSSAPSLAVPTSIETSNKKDTDIEIISEHYPTRPRQIQTNLQAKQPTDEEYKQYLKSSYNLDSLLTLSTKPQCNFVSNLACIDQLLAQCKYDETKKPFTVLKRVYNQINDDLESLSQDELNVCRKSDRTIKKQKLIVINDEENGDDDKDEAHKPWITPQLLQLIKQRNLLQSKLGQQQEGGDGEKSTTTTQPDPELLQKFKNLRNKVTKLVKNARKEYLTKIIREKKEKEAAQANSNTSITVTGGVTTTAADSTTSTTSQPAGTGASLQSTLLTLSQQHPITQTQIQQALASTHSSMMMNFYNTFFNQYMQQYTQHKLQKPPETGDSEKDNYEYLKQQASYYAQQQHNVQTQLESCLSSTVQQFMNELSSQAAAAATTTTTTLTPSTSSIAATTTATITASKQQQQLPFNPTYHYNTTT